MQFGDGEIPIRRHAAIVKRRRQLWRIPTFDLVVLPASPGLCLSQRKCRLHDVHRSLLVMSIQGVNSLAPSASPQQGSIHGSQYADHHRWVVVDMLIARRSHRAGFPERTLDTCRQPEGHR